MSSDYVFVSVDDNDDASVDDLCFYFGSCWEKAIENVPVDDNVEGGGHNDHCRRHVACLSDNCHHDCDFSPDVLDDNHLEKRSEM